jgi:hypothetical protein
VPPEVAALGQILVLCSQASLLACRHTEGNEARAFTALFPSGITIAPGGVASGLKQVADAATPELYRLSGRRTFCFGKVPLDSRSLNSGDGFLLSAPSSLQGPAVYQWVGKHVSRSLKLQLLMHAQELKSSMKGSAQVHRFSNASLLAVTCSLLVAVVDWAVRVELD